MNKMIAVHRFVWPGVVIGKHDEICTTFQVKNVSEL